MLNLLQKADNYKKIVIFVTCLSFALSQQPPLFTEAVEKPASILVVSEGGVITPPPNSIWWQKQGL